jgi:hypothetical protein
MLNQSHRAMEIGASGKGRASEVGASEVRDQKSENGDQRLSRKVSGFRSMEPSIFPLRGGVPYGTESTDLHFSHNLS